MQGVEIAGCCLEHARVDLFGIAQTALPMQREPLLQGLAGMKRAGLHSGAIAWRCREVNQRS